MFSFSKIFIGLATLAVTTLAAPTAASSFSDITSGLAYVGRTLGQTDDLINAFPATGGTKSQTSEIWNFVFEILDDTQAVNTSVKFHVIPFSPSEVTSIASSFNANIPGYESVLSDIVTKKALFEAAAGSKTDLDNSYKSLLTSLKQNNDDLLNAVVAAAPTDSKQQIVDIKTKLDADFDTAITAYSS